MCDAAVVCLWLLSQAHHAHLLLFTCVPRLGSFVVGFVFQVGPLTSAYKAPTPVSSDNESGSMRKAFGGAGSGLLHAGTIKAALLAKINRIDWLRYTNALAQIESRPAVAPPPPPPFQPRVRVLLLLFVLFVCFVLFLFLFFLFLFLSLFLSFCFCFCSFVFVFVFFFAFFF